MLNINDMSVIITGGCSGLGYGMAKNIVLKEPRLQYVEEEKIKSRKPKIV